MDVDEFLRQSHAISPTASIYTAGTDDHDLSYVDVAVGTIDFVIDVFNVARERAVSRRAFAADTHFASSHSRRSKEYSAAICPNKGAI